MTDPTPPDDATPAAPTPAETSTGAAAPAAGASRPRPSNPSAAAARRARQMGGTRRASPRPGASPTTGNDDAEGAPLVESAGRGTPASTAATSATTGTTPRSPVGKAAARPRPRPRPTAAPTADESEQDATPATAGAGATRAPRRGLIAAGAALAVLLLATGVVFLVLALTATPQISQQDTDRAVAAAKTDVALITSYGYQTVDADAAKASAELTGQFKQQYLDGIDKSVKPNLPSTETVSTGQVDTAGLVSADARGRQVVVLVYGQQSVVNKAQTTPRIDAFQVRVTMQLVSGRWLVSQLEQLGNNA